MFLKSDFPCKDEQLDKRRVCASSSASPHSRGISKYRGVTLHKCGRWEARMKQLLGKKRLRVWLEYGVCMFLASALELIMDLSRLRMNIKYGPMEPELGGPGKASLHSLAAKMALGLSTGVLWVMCKHDDASNPIDYNNKLEQLQASF